MVTPQPRRQARSRGMSSSTLTQEATLTTDFLEKVPRPRKMLRSCSLA